MLNDEKGWVSLVLQYLYILCLCRSRPFSYFLLKSPALFEQGATFWSHSPSKSVPDHERTFQISNNTHQCCFFFVLAQIQHKYQWNRNLTFSLNRNHLDKFCGSLVFVSLRSIPSFFPCFEQNRQQVLFYPKQVDGKAVIGAKKQH